MSILIDKASLAVAAFAAKDAGRRAFAGILLEEGRAVAADGFRLMAADLPASEGEGGRLLVPAREIDGAVRFLKPKDDEALAVTPDGAGGATVGRPHGVGAQLPVPLVDGTFPAWRALRPREEPIARVVLDARYLAEAAKALAAFGTNNGGVEVRVHGHDRAVEIRARRPQDGREAFALVMPMSLPAADGEGGS